MSKMFWLGVVLVGMARIAQAQGPMSESRDLRRDQGPSAVSPTPEMWFYEQERTRYEDSKGAVRRKAEARASQRAGRLASMKWYGMSNSRPVANATPLFGTYSPMWVSNSADPNQWRSVVPSVVVRQSNGLY
jgi:hypothetical protein